MSKWPYGTDHERCLGSGIVSLSQIADINTGDSYLCEDEQDKIEREFRRGVCNPWLPWCRLKAEIEEHQWNTRTSMSETTLGDFKFSRLCFGDTKICILGSVARLQVVRFSRARKLMKVFSRLGTEERSWIVDFYKPDSSKIPIEELYGNQETACRYFLPQTRERSATDQVNNLLSNETIDKEARAVRDINGVGDAFRDLSQLPSLWNTTKCTYLSDVRKSFCDEETKNYIQAIVDQWRDITLQWNPEITKCVDFKSVKLLQSRAPSISKDDLNFVQERFENQEIFPQLKDPAIRHQVEGVIRRQGPILTLKTFAKDVRLLQLRVHGSLNDLVSGISRKKKKETLRKRICKSLGEEFDSICGETGLHSTTGKKKRELVLHCYYHVFLYVIRTKTRVTRAHLRSLMKQELVRCCTQEREPSSESMVTDAGVIATQAPTNDWPDAEVDIEERHGSLLFEQPAATKLLYYNRMTNSSPPPVYLTRSSMAEYIFSIFLFGSAAVGRIQDGTSDLTTAIAHPVRTVLHPTSFDISPISICTTSEGLNHSQESPTRIHAPTILDVQHVHEYRTQISTAAKSMSASLISAELSPSDSIHTSNGMAMKRPASISGFGYSKPLKRHKGELDRPEEDVVLAETGDPHFRRRMGSIQNLLPQAVSTASPSSVYSVEDGRSLTSQTNNYRFSGCDDRKKELRYRLDLEDYYKLRSECDPCLDRPNHFGSKSQTVSPVSQHTDAVQQPHSRPRLDIPTQDDIQEPRTAGTLTERSDYIVFKLLNKPKFVLCIPRTEQCTKDYLEDQHQYDRSSTFRYKLNRCDKYASNIEQVHQDINRHHDISTVFVVSEGLAGR